MFLSLIICCMVIHFKIATNAACYRQPQLHIHVNENKLTNSYRMLIEYYLFHDGSLQVHINENKSTNTYRMLLI